MPQETQSADIEEFLKWLSLERRLSPYTHRNYAHALNSFDEWRSQSKSAASSWESVSTAILKSYLIHLQRSKSRRTVHNHFAALRAFFKFMRERKLMSHNPCSGVILPKLEKTLPKFLTEKQMLELLNSPMIMLESGRLDAFEAWRDRLVMEIIYGGGLRISEATGLDYEDIDSGGIAKVLGKGNKTRLCPLGQVAMKCLENYKTHSPTQSGAILVNAKGIRLGPRQIQLLLKKHLKHAALPNDITPHKLRHSYATHMLNNGADLRLVQELLGHASLSSTQIYTHVDMNRLKKAYDQAHPRAE